MINFNDIGAWHFVSELDILEADSHEDVTVTIADAAGAAVLNLYPCGWQGASVSPV